MDLQGISEETLELVKKAQTSGVDVSTGITGRDLSGVVSLVPVNTPFYSRVPREQGDGSAAAQWRVLLNVNNSQPNPFTGDDGGGNFIQISELDALANYKPVRVSGKVTRDAIDKAKNYADAKAISATQTLMQWRIADNRALLGGQGFALPVMGAVTLTKSVTGGLIANSTAIYVKAQARSPYNYYYGGSNVASAEATITTDVGTGVNSVTATVASIRGAVAYDWFASGSTGTWWYVATTTYNAYTFTAIPTANATTIPAGIPGLYVTPPTAVTASDTSYSTNSYNGLIATLSGSYANGGTGLVTYGSGSSTASGATITSNNAAKLTATSQGITQIDAMLMNIYSNVQMSPTVMIMNAQAAQDIALGVLGTSSAVTFITPENPARRGFDAGATVSGYINRASGGDRVEILVDPHFPQGSIAFLSERVPFPNSGISNTMSARTLRDVSQFDYGVSLVPHTSAAGGGPREEWDMSSQETFVNRAPVACGLLTDILPGI